MPQTMLATLALVMALMYSNDVSQRRIDFDRNNLKMEVEEMATAVALETLARIRELPYDDGLKPLDQYKGLDGRLLGGVTEATILGDLSALSATNKRCKNVRGRDPKELEVWKLLKKTLALLDDDDDEDDELERPDRKRGYGSWRDDCATMNDFNGARTMQIAYPLSSSEVVFDVDVEMTYVESSGGAMVPVALPQLQKQVTIVVIRRVGRRRADGRIPAHTPIRISRVFSLEV